MPTSQDIKQNFGEWTVRWDIDLANTGTVSATRGDGIVVTKTGVGTYTIRVERLVFFEVLERAVDLHFGTVANEIQGAVITGIDLDGAGDGTGCVISITTYDDNATPAAANITVTSTCVMSGHVTFRMWKIP